MTVVKNEAGEWVVVSGSRQIAGPFATMSQGWRWIDIQEVSPLNRGQAVAEWRFNEETSQ